MLYARDVEFRIIAIDPTETRRKKVEAIYTKVSEAYGKQRNGHLEVSDIAASTDVVTKWTEGIGCNSVLEVSMMSPRTWVDKNYRDSSFFDTGRWKHECSFARV